MNEMRLPTDANASGRRLGEEELRLLREVVESGVLNGTRGPMVPRLEREFAARHESGHAVAVSSGSMAVHAAMAAINPQPGDEIVTTPITDMGAIAPILYQGAVPAFADVEPDSLNVSARTIERALNRRTRAIVVTHLFGAPCEMAPILDLAKSRGLPVVEDAAQAFLAIYHGQLVGTMGQIGCFSLQQGKHMTCGEGGLLLTRDDKYARHMTLFRDKGWGYGDATPDHEFLAPNGRMTELQAAVAVAQLEKLDAVVASRRARAAQFRELMADVPGLTPQRVPDGAQSSYWKFALLIDEAQTRADVGQIAAYLRQEFEIQSAPRYVQKPAFECRVIRDRRTLGESGFPLAGAHLQAPVCYQREDFPGTYDALRRVLVLPWNENYTPAHVEFLASALRRAVAHFRD